MRATTHIAALWAILLLAGSAAAQPPLRAPGPSVITNPDWIEKPSGDEVSTVFPAAAQLLLIPGRVVIGCRVAVSGDVEACRVLEEEPKGEGFGAAALLLTPRFKMRPQTRDGVAVAGAEVHVPIRFALGADLLPSAPADAPPPPEPSARAMALGERIALAFGHEELPPSGIGGYAVNLDRIARSQIGDPEQAEARDAAVADYVQAMSSRGGLMHRARVLAIARTFSEAELGQIADFLEAPAGRAFVAKGPEVNQAMAVETADVIRAATAEARKVYCASRACTPALAHAPAPK